MQGLIIRARRDEEGGEENIIGSEIYLTEILVDCISVA